MQLQDFIVTYWAFQYSDITSELKVPGESEEDAKCTFERLHPSYLVKEVKPA